MKNYSLISEKDGKVFHANECRGLIQCVSVDNVFSDGFLVTFANVFGAHDEKYLPLNEIFKISKIINSKAVEIGYLQCKRLLFERSGEQVYLTSLLNVDIKKIHILDCFVNNVQIQFRELERSYALSWLSACSVFHFIYGSKGYFSSEVVLDVTSLRSVEDFYCYLGEIFFGYAGYAGRDLDGCCEILKSQGTERKIVLTIPDENKAKRFLADATGYFNYYDEFKVMIEDIGGEIVTDLSPGNRIS